MFFRKLYLIYFVVNNTFRYDVLFKSAVLTQIFSTPKHLFRNLYLKFACPIEYHSCTLSILIFHKIKNALLLSEHNMAFVSHFYSIRIAGGLLFFITPFFRTRKTPPLSAGYSPNYRNMPCKILKLSRYSSYFHASTLFFLLPA